MIDTASILQIIAGVAGVWAVGFSAGKTVAWIRKIVDAA